MLFRKQDFNMIQDWIYRNARPLDYERWNYHFASGDIFNVYQILKRYQNSDGGFGSGLEPDSWNPNSSPYTTAIAIGHLLALNCQDHNNPIIIGILNYLENTELFNQGKWPAVIPSNDEYPHAPWWSYTADCSDSVFGYTPTAALASFLLCYGKKDSYAYQTAWQVANDAMRKYLYGKNEDGSLYRSSEREGEIGNIHQLLLAIEASGRGDEFEIEKLKVALKEHANNSFERDPQKWSKYTFMPSYLITAPDDLFYEGNEELIKREIQYLLNNRNKDGVWDITWKWEGYKKEFSISENWWKASNAIRYLLLFKNFGMLTFDSE